MQFKPSIRPAALLGLTLAAALAAGCQSTTRASGMGASGTPSQMSNSPSNGPRSTSSTGVTNGETAATSNSGTGTRTDSGRAEDK